MPRQVPGARRWLQGFDGGPATARGGDSHPAPGPAPAPPFPRGGTARRRPLREHSPVRYFSKFYGQWGGQTHLEQLSVESLARLLETACGEGITELSCHPGYLDADFSSSYSSERETEVRTLCDPLIRRVLAEQSIQLINYRHLSELAVALPA